MAVIGIVLAACVGIVLTSCGRNGSGSSSEKVPVDATRMAEAREACRSGGATGSFHDVVREEIRALPPDGSMKTLDATLCVASEHAEVQTYWFWREQPGGDFVSLGVDVSGHLVDGLRASPDGTYLAVQMLVEVLNGVEVADLPGLIRQRTYRSVGVIASFPGSATIDGWADNRTLTVRADTLLGRPSRAPGELALFLGTDDRFSWDVSTGKIVPLDNELRNPVQYYCDRVSADDTQTRLMSIVGLRALGDQSAVPCLERALNREQDRTLRQEFAHALQRLRGL